MDAARRQWRHHAGGVTDQGHAIGLHGRHRTAARNEAGADAVRSPRGIKPDHGGDMREEAGHVRRLLAAGPIAPRQTRLHTGRRLRDPAQIARCAALADEAVQGIGFAQRHVVEFVLHAMQELRHLSEAETLRDQRSRAVGTDQNARMAYAVHVPTRRCARGAPEGLSPAQFDAAGLHVLAHPAHQRRRIGGVETVTVCAQSHAAQVRRVQPDMGNGAEQGGRQARQQRRVAGLLDQDAGGVHALAEILLAVDHADTKTPGGEFMRAGEAGESGTDHDHVIAVVLHRPACAPSGDGGQRADGAGSRDEVTMKSTVIHLRKERRRP